MSPISSSASPLFSPKSPHSRSNDSTLLQLQLENELLMTRAEAAERRSELLSTEVDRLNDCMLQTQRACEEAQGQVEQLRKQEAEARNELDNLDREYRDCAYHLKSLTEKNADLIKALQEESRTRAKMEAASKRLAAENETLRSRADKLNIEVARESTERKSSTSIVKDLQKETERLREELNSVRIDHKLLLEKKASGEQQLQEKIQSLDSLSRSYQDELAACKQRLAAIEHERIEKVRLESVEQEEKEGGGGRRRRKEEGRRREVLTPAVCRTGSSKSRAEDHAGRAGGEAQGSAGSGDDQQRLHGEVGGGGEEETGEALDCC